MAIELDDRLGNIGERESRELEARLRGCRRDLVARIGDHQHEQLVEAELVDRRSRECDVTEMRRIEDAAENAVLPLELLVADLDLRARLDAETPKGFLELLGRRRRPDDPVAAIGSVDPKPRPASRARRVLEKLGESRRRRPQAPAARRGRARRARASSSSIPLPVAHEVATTPATRASSTVNSGVRSRRSTLFSTTSCGRSVEAGPVGLELAVDHAEPLLEIRLGCVDDVDEEPRALEVGEELVAEAGTVGRALDEPRDVGDGELSLLRPVHDSEHGLERRERIVRDLRLRIRDAAQERRLARVREAGERGVHHELEPKLELELVPGQARLREARRLPSGSREARVATSALAAARHDDGGRRVRSDRR